MKPTMKRRRKPRIKSKNKSYSPKDSPLYNLTTKKRLEKLLGKSVNELKDLLSVNNYRVFFIEKNGKKREIQAPTYELDVVHTRIASMLVRIAVPDYLHSGIKGRSNITNAKVHIGDHPVLTMDIQKFYPSVTKKSIYHYFQYTMNAAPEVAGVLAELCSYDDHIPTGSRLSMPLSFWVNYSMYSSIHSYCLRKEGTMSVFVDDLTFSGKNVNKLFSNSVAKIVQDAGLIVHPGKTQLYGRDIPKLITGVIVDGDGTSVRNKHHKSIYTLFSDIPKCNDDAQLEEMQKELIGRLNAAGQIDPAFKQRASQVRRVGLKSIKN